MLTLIVIIVFLRELEYYSGILFLTTNRPGVIDEAFLSRIHMAFRYPAIDLRSTKMMWNNILDRIERDNKNPNTEFTITFNRGNLLRFAEKDFLRREQKGKPWNGRQIRNAFNTAIGLGRYQRLQSLKDKGISPNEAAACGEKKFMTVKLTKRNFEDVAAAALSFEDYIQDLRGMTNSEIARVAKVRDDHWGSESPVAVKDYSHLRMATTLRAQERPRPSTAMTDFTAKESDQSGIRLAQSVRSDDSDDESSDDD